MAELKSYEKSYHILIFRYYKFWLKGCFYQINIHFYHFLSYSIVLLKLLKAKFKKILYFSKYNNMSDV